MSMTAASHPPTSQIRVSANAAELVGQRIRRAREQAALTQGELATAIGRNQTAISYWEAGRRSPDIDDLVDLAEGLGVDINFFFGDDRIRQPRRVLLRAQLEPLHDWADAIEVFEKEVAELEPLARKIRVRSDTPVRASEELLAQGRVVAPPVHIDKLAKQCGVHVRPADLPDQISGILLFVESTVVIGFNETHPAVRQRFSIAHELGHFLLSHHDHFHIDLNDQAANGNPPDYNWQDERAANDFAAAALMPSAMVTDFFEDDTSLDALARRFKVSREAMGWRLVSLGLVGN